MHPPLEPIHSNPICRKNNRKQLIEAEEGSNPSKQSEIATKKWAATTHVHVEAEKNTNPAA
jgi:hypothetical protein